MQQQNIELYMLPRITSKTICLIHYTIEQYSHIWY